MTPWEILGLEPTPDERAIKRAYAQKLKHTRPEEDKEGFLQLREAYERALDQRHWVTEEADPDEALEVETTPSPAASHAPALDPTPLRVQWQIDPPSLPPELTMPAQPRKDYRRGWRTASRLSEEALILRIEEDLGDPALVHLEARAAYERNLLVWLLKHTVLWPRAFQMAQETLQWREKHAWQEWPWSQLETYHRRCLLRAFFTDPDLLWKEFHELGNWMAKNPVPISPQHIRPLASVLDRADLKRELAQFRSDYKDELQYEPEGKARLDTLELVLKRFPTMKAIGYLFNLLLGIGLLVVSWQNSWVILLLASIVPIVISVIVFVALANDFLDADL